MTRQTRKTPTVSANPTGPASFEGATTGQSYQADDDFAADARGPAPRKKSGALFFLKFLGLTFGIGLIALVGFGAYAFWYMTNLAEDVPGHEVLADYEPPVTTRVYGGDGSLVAEFATESRLFVPIEAIPAHVKNAFISAEDQNFYTHDGLDYRSIVRGMVIQNALNKLRGRNRRLIGASTITQQVAKNFLLTADTTIDRKLKEWIVARRIEETFTKDKILELYLNEIYLGNRAYGVAAAALNYFDKPLGELTIQEAAYLAAIPKGPSNYHPITKRERAVERRNWVISRMLADGHVDEETARLAQESELGAKIAPPLGAREWTSQYFAEQVRKEISALYGSDALYDGGLAVRTTVDPRLQRTAGKALRKWLIAYDMRHGWRGAMATMPISDDWATILIEKTKVLTDEKVIGNDLDPWTPAVVLSVSAKEASIGLPDGREVILPLAAANWARDYVSANKQGAFPDDLSDVLSPGDIIFAEPATKAPAKPQKPEGEMVDLPEGAYALRQVPAINGGFIAIDPHTGRVLALVGGFSFQLSEFNRAVQALRQPGSTFKPFVYSLALDSGYTPASVVLDAPFVAPAFGDKWWKPGNYIEGRFNGLSTLRHGIEKSRNTMTARLAQDLGIGPIMDYVDRFDLSDNMPRELAISLGSGETTLMRLTTAYAIFVNGGKKIEPVLIDRVQDRSGATIYRRDDRLCDGCKVDRWDDQAEPQLTDGRSQIVDPRTAYQMVSMLEGVVTRGTGRSIGRTLDKPVAGKTGTTNDYKDAWFVGFSPDLAAGAYVGFDLPRTLGVGEAGGKVAAPIFGEFMAEALKDEAAIPFRVPSGVRLVRINAATGKPARFGDADVVLEVFKAEDDIQNQRVLDDDDLDPLSAAPGLPGANDLDDLGGIY
ncbi:MAG: penicillin-binding protein 1A [Pseudomonadota bacterium]